MKKYISVILIFLLSIILGSCQTNHVEKTDNYAHVTFLNYDESVLYHTKVKVGSYVNYCGKTPNKLPTESKVYEFAGWDYNLSKPITKHTIIRATFSESKRKYLVLFFNYNDDLLWQMNVDYGNYAKFGGETPTRKSDNERIEYQFKDWDKPLDKTKIIEDTNFIAQYNVVEYVFAEFRNFDNTILENKKIVKNSIPTYTGKTPTRSYTGEGEKAYKFTGWDKKLTSITKDEVYTAQYDLKNIYTVTFNNHDGSFLSESKVISGEDAVYNGTTPTKASTTSGDYVYSYVFSGWSKSLKNIVSNITVTAQFTTNTKVTGKTGIIEHLNKYGSGDYSYVDTGSGTKLGYKNNMFYLSYTGVSDSLIVLMNMGFTYGDTDGVAIFEVYQNNILMFSAKYYVYTSYHQFDSISVYSISTNRYTSDDDLKTLALMTIAAAELVITETTDYLVSYSLAYIY